MTSLASYNLHLLYRNYDLVSQFMFYILPMTYAIIYDFYIIGKVICIIPHGEICLGPPVSSQLTHNNHQTQTIKININNRNNSNKKIK